MGIDLTLKSANPKLQEELREACENAKKTLDTADVAHIKLENVDESGLDWQTTISLAQFNEAI